MAQAKLGVLEEDTAGSFSMGMLFPDHDQRKDTLAYVESHAKFSSDFRPPDCRPKELFKSSVANPKEAFEQLHDIKPLSPYNIGSVLTLAHGLNAKPSLWRSETKVTSYMDPSAKVFEPSFSKPAFPQPEIAVKNSVFPSGAQAVVSNVEASQNPSAVSQNKEASQNPSAVSQNKEASQNPSAVSQTLQVSETENSASEEILKLSKTLAEQVILSRLPPPKPTVFDGDPLKFPGWKGAFHNLIEQKQIPASEKIHYLRKYLSSSVREVVENYFLLSSEDAFEEAKKLLEQRYGDPFVIGNAFRNKLERLPRIMAKDGEGLKKFADFLNQCHTAMHSMKCLNILDKERVKKGNSVATHFCRVLIFASS